MSEPISQAFADAFITTCFDAGLTESATAGLLQKESVDRVKRESPAWSEGYDSIMGDRRPLLSLGVEKNAMLRGLGQTAKALLWDAPKGLLTAGWGGAKGTANLVGKMKGKPGGFMSRHPGAVGLGGAALGAGGVVGGAHLMNGLGGRNYGPTDPLFESGSWSQGDYDKNLQGTLARFKEDDYGFNKKYHDSATKLQELEAANKGGMGGAGYRQLQELRRSHAALQEQHDKRFEDLNSQQSKSEALMERIGGGIESAEGQRSNLWGLPHRMFRNEDQENEYFDNRVGKLHSQRMTQKLQQDIIKARRRWLNSGVIEDDPRATSAPPSRQQIQDTFFPRYGAVR